MAEITQFLPFYLSGPEKMLQAAQWHLVRVLMPVCWLSRERKDLGGQGVNDPSLVSRYVQDVRAGLW